MSEPIRVYVPERGIVLREAISSTNDEIGALVANGEVAEADYWQVLSCANEAHARALRVQLSEEKKKAFERAELIEKMGSIIEKLGVLL